MKSRVEVIKDDEIIHIHESEVKFNIDNFQEVINEFQLGVVEGSENILSLYGIKIFYGELYIDSPLELIVSYDTPYLMILFELEGDSIYIPENREKNKKLKIKSNQYNFFYIPENAGTIYYNSPKRKFFSILFTVEYVKNLFQNNFNAVSAEFGKAVESNKPFIMYSDSQRIPPKLMEIIYDISNCEYEHRLKEVYVQSKLMEIFTHIFAQLNRDKTQQIQWSDRDLELLNKIESLISKNPSEILTLETVAKRVGSNQSKIKKDFKRFYGESIFEYQLRQRMEKSKLMLKETDLTIAEISYAIGYKNPQHFTAAFKKKYHSLPKDFRQSLN